MFRLTERANADRLTLTLEGRLSEAAVDALVASWLAARLKAAGRPIWIDLSDVLTVDQAACDQLARMHLSGACFVTRGCLMREVVRQITGPPPSAEGTTTAG